MPPRRKPIESVRKYTQCGICSHPERAEIDRSLIMMTPVRRLEQKFSLSKSSINNHSRNHLKRTDILVKAADAVVLDTPQKILDQYEWNYNKLKTLHKSAEETYDTRLQEKALVGMAALLDRYAKYYKMWEEPTIHISTNERKLQLVIDQMSEEELRAYLTTQQQPLQALMTDDIIQEEVLVAEPEIVIEQDPPTTLDGDPDE